MNCTACKKPLKAGATKCSCGAAAATNYSYDLLPEEPESKKEESGPGAQYQLPPGALLPPGMTVPEPKAPGDEKKPTRVLRADRPRGANALAGGKTNYFKLGVGAGAVLIVILLGMRMCGGPSVKITGATKLDQTFTAFNTMTLTRPFEITGGKAEYTFTVEAKTGDLSIGVVPRGSRDKVTPEIVKGWNLTPLKKGESKTLSGELDSGSYSFVVSTESKIGIQGTIKATVK